MLWSQLTPIIVGSAGLVFCVALTVYVYRQGARGRSYIPALVLIAIASLSTLVRGLWFPGSTVDPATISGRFRLATLLLALAGGIMLERAWRRQRKQAP